MKVVLDTNVLISGICWSGTPKQILDHWSQNQFRVAISPEILAEYVRTAKVLEKKYPKVAIATVIGAIALRADLLNVAPLAAPVSRDPDDDKFIACALAAKAQCIVSGDGDLLSVSDPARVLILTPRLFLDTYFPK